MFINKAKQTLIDVDCDVNDELYNAFIAEYDICGNKQNCRVNIKYRMYIVILLKLLLILQQYFLVIDNAP